MKALTIRQPRAQLIALGIKTIETRSWRTNYRGPLAIHAGMQWAPGFREWIDPDDDDDWKLDLVDLAGGDTDEDTNSGIYYRPAKWSLPLGEVVATANLVDCIPIVASGSDDGLTRCVSLTDMRPPNFVSCAPFPRLVRFSDADTEGVDITDQLPYGDFTPGRWAWILDDVEQCDPIPAKGRQGLWEWTR